MLFVSTVCTQASMLVRLDDAVQVGESGLGKTTFIQNLKSAFQPDSPSSARIPLGLGAAADMYETFEHSPEQLCTEVAIDNGCSKFHYYLQVTSLLIHGLTLQELCLPFCMAALHKVFLSTPYKEAMVALFICIQPAPEPSIDDCMTAYKHCAAIPPKQHHCSWRMSKQADILCTRCPHIYDTSTNSRCCKLRQEPQLQN